MPSLPSSKASLQVSIPSPVVTIDLLAHMGKPILVPAGMYHLASENVVHRDLAARNVLVCCLTVPAVSPCTIPAAIADWPVHCFGHHQLDLDQTPRICMSTTSTLVWSWLDLISLIDQFIRSFIIHCFCFSADFGMARVLEGNTDVGKTKSDFGPIKWCVVRTPQKRVLSISLINNNEFLSAGSGWHQSFLSNVFFQRR